MNLQSQEEFLAKCTVRIQAVGKSGYGTGFFVAPDLILTCAHVIRKNGQILKQVKFYWQEEEYQAEVYQVPKDNKNVDITLLKVSNLVNDKFVISLFDDTLATGDELYTFGYPDNNVNGEPGTFEIIGLTGDKPPLMKFKEGQVRPGFSGSPLLNLQTGKVCGIINKTLDRSSALGGKGVPVSVIFKHFPELKPTVIPPNPFIPLSGKISDSNLIFGRDKEIREIFEILNSGGGVALIGDKGSGKSSLLSAIEKQTSSKLYFERKPVYLNMSNVYDEQDFYIAICDSADIKVQDNIVLRGNNFYRIVKNHRLLLILDDPDKIAWDGFTNQVRRQIRALASEGNNSPFRLVVAARKSLKQLFADSGQDSPFEEICQEILVKPWQDFVIKDLIQTRLQHNLIVFTEFEIRQIITESKGYPYQVMKLCNQLYREKCDE